MKKSMVYEIAQLIPRDKRRQGLLLVGLLVVSSLLDFFSLAFFLPLIFMLINPETASEHPLVHRIFQWLDLESMTTLSLIFMVFVFGFLLLKTVVSGWITSKKAAYAYAVSTDLAMRAARRYFSLSHAAYTHINLSQEVNLIAYLPLIIANNIIIPAGTLLSEGLIFVLLLSAIAVFDPPVFGMLFLLLLPSYLLYRLSKQSIRSISQSIKSDYPALIRYALIVVEGLGDIKAFGKADYFSKKFEDASKQLGHVFARDHAARTGTPRLTEVIAAACIFTLMGYALLTSQGQQEMILLLAVYAGVSFRIIPSINRMLSALQHMRVHEYAVKEFTAVVRDVPDKTPQPETAVTFEDKIELRKVSFGYPEQPGLLKDVNLTLRKGERIALIGRSGTGKTTLLLLLLRFIREQQGGVWIDGRDLQEESDASWRNRTGYVPQNPYIIDGSIAENIAFTLDQQAIDEGRIRRLIGQMDLADWVASLPDGIHARIGEKGGKISGGQRQRLAIARALYHDPDVLLLDEITNQLDRQTEAEVINTLFNASRGNQTIVMITHYPDLLNRFDSVYELKDGQLSAVRPPFAEVTSSSSYR